MLNQTVLVGRLVDDIKVNTTETGKSVATVTLAIPRSFKNMEGLYDTDFIECVLWDNIANNTKEYCKKGDIVGIKGRIQSRIIDPDNQNEKTQQIIAEKVTFLSSGGREKEEGLEK